MNAYEKLATGSIYQGLDARRIWLVEQPWPGRVELQGSAAPLAPGRGRDVAGPFTNRIRDLSW